MPRLFQSLCALTLTLACAAPDRRAAEPGEWFYGPTVERGGEELAVRAIFPPGAALALDVAPATRDYIEDVFAFAIRGDRALERSAGGWLLPASDGPRPVRWRFRARDAGRTVDNADVAAWGGGGFAGSLTAFLLADREAAQAATLALAVELEPGSAFACALPERDGGWEAPAEELAGLPACAFGAIAVARTHSGAHTLVLADLSARPEPYAAALAQWVAGAEAGLERALGRFPVEELLVTVMPRARAGVGHGRTRGFGGAAVVIEVNARATPEELAQDWVLWHEFVHLALPSLASEHAWLEEGSATYLEPLLRARAGLLTQDEVWAAMLDEYSQGLPEPGDRGLDLDPSWGRTYYGGAMFCLAADVEIRARTGNRRSLLDAFAGVVAAGGNVRRSWPIERVIEVADEAAGVPVLRELYAERRAAPGPRELDSLWRRLGVAVVEGRVVFDDAAPLADVRRALILGP